MPDDVRAGFEVRRALAFQLLEALLFINTSGRRTEDGRLDRSTGAVHSKADLTGRTLVVIPTGGTPAALAAGARPVPSRPEGLTLTGSASTAPAG